MSEELFTQTIFPSVKKESNASFNFNDPSKKDDEFINSLARVFEGIGCTVYCGINKDWVSLVTCIGCKENTRTLEELLQDEVGCWPNDIQEC